MLVMRSCVLICSMALLAIPAATTFSQDMAGSDSGISVAVGGGVALVSEIAKAKGGFWYEKDGKEYYLDPSTGERKDGTPALKDVDPDPKYGFELGWTVSGALGYQFGDVRAEAEVSYTSANQNMAGGVELTDDTLPSLNLLSLMANGWYEIDTGTMFRPVVGVGLGAVQGAYSSANADGTSGSSGMDFNGWGFAVQGAAGVAVEVSDGLSVQLGYRLFAAPQITLTSEVSGPNTDLAGNSADKTVGGLAFPLWVQRIELGLSYILPL